MTRLTRKSNDKDYKEYKDNLEEENKWFDFKMPIRTKEEWLEDNPYQWNAEARTTNAVIQKISMLEDLEEEIGCPLEVLFKALKNGIYHRICKIVNGKRKYEVWFAKPMYNRELSLNWEADCDYQIQVGFDNTESWETVRNGFGTFRYIDGFEFAYSLEDYGKTWWLEKPKEVEE